MNGYTTTRGTIMAETDPSGAPTDHGPLYLQPQDGDRRLLLASSSMAARVSVEIIAEQSRSRFLPSLGKVIAVSGYRTSDTIYEASIVTSDPPPFDNDLDAPDGK